MNFPCDSKNQNIFHGFHVGNYKANNFRDSKVNTKNTKYCQPLTNFAESAKYTSI